MLDRWLKLLSPVGFGVEKEVVGAHRFERSTE